MPLVTLSPGWTLSTICLNTSWAETNRTPWRAVSSTDGPPSAPSSRWVANKQQTNMLTAESSTNTAGRSDPEYYARYCSSTPEKRVFQQSWLQLPSCGPTVGALAFARRCSSVVVTAVFALSQDSLHALMATLSTSDPYFIRCIKPNTHKVGAHTHKHTHGNKQSAADRQEREVSDPVGALWPQVA